MNLLLVLLEDGNFIQAGQGYFIQRLPVLPHYALIQNPELLSSVDRHLKCLTYRMQTHLIKPHIIVLFFSLSQK